MGFLSNLMGMGGAKSDAKKEKIRNIFNEQVKDGESYSVFAGFNIVVKDKLLKQVSTYYNYLIGYKDGDDPEMVIISTDNKLSSFKPPVYCKKSECSQANVSKEGLFSIWHPAFEKEPLRFGVSAFSAMHLDSYLLKVSYVNEYEPFATFFQNRFAK
jgi:hypothetical protein